MGTATGSNPRPEQDAEVAALRAENAELRHAVDRLTHAVSEAEQRRIAEVHATLIALLAEDGTAGRWVEQFDWVRADLTDESLAAFIGDGNAL